jgi:hypothetical protein
MHSSTTSMVCFIIEQLAASVAASPSSPFAQSGHHAEKMANDGVGVDIILHAQATYRRFAPQLAMSSLSMIQALVPSLDSDHPTPMHSF